MPSMPMLTTPETSEKQDPREANTSGGVTGKMISPQSIAVACAATGMVGRESELFRYTVKHSLIFASVIGIITLLQAYVFTGMLVS